MERKQQATIVGIGMVCVGLIEAVWGVLQDELVFVGLGLGFAGFGVVYLRYQQ